MVLSPLLCSSEETLMTARWYAAWILAFDIAIVVCMYGLWLTVTLTGKLSNIDGDGLPHHVSLTGLNLSGGNGVLSYEDGGTKPTTEKVTYKPTHVC
jgi:hypothetical protein